MLTKARLELTLGFFKLNCILTLDMTNITKKLEKEFMAKANSKNDIHQEYHVTSFCLLIRQFIILHTKTTFILIFFFVNFLIFL